MWPCGYFNGMQCCDQVCPLPRRRWAGQFVGHGAPGLTVHENIRLGASASGPYATISERTFLGNITEYYASLDSGPTLRVQTHPGQVFAVGDKVAIEVDASQCSVFRSS